MTLEIDVRNASDRLDLWFVATLHGRPHPTATHSVSHHIDDLPSSVTFTSSHPDKLPLPSPELLLLHSTCAEVAHLSGTTAYMDKIDLDIEEDAEVLAEDGGSAELLQHAILSRLGNPISGSKLCHSVTLRFRCWDSLLGVAFKLTISASSTMGDLYIGVGSILRTVSASFPGWIVVVVAVLS
ncbi:hypothetical protein EUX98_g9502 [Antrodiella citrinella]|uniref:Uncharacterized protein n=1 Tax=Antrodiella citrinella TaxID=2447956 RepID=A0A4S4LS61_9APHY|nr:hypothetical protein EUX98_g9502 [Antrodiella citrinella]